MASRLSVVSTPNLFTTSDGYLYSLGDDVNFRASNHSLSRAHSLKRINFESESELSRAGGSSHGSNLLITTSFINLSKSLSGGSKGVHFCPVVSEVSWCDSDGDCSDSDDNSSTNSLFIPEPMVPLTTTSSVAQSQIQLEETIPKCTKLPNTQINREMSPTVDEFARRLLSDPVRNQKHGDIDKERTRRAQCKRLNLISSPPPEQGGPGHVIPMNAITLSSDRSSTSNSNFSHNHKLPALTSCSMNSQASDASVGSSPSSKSKSSSMGRLGSFFQRFSLKRLSSRKSGKSKSSKNKSNCETATPPPVVVGCVRKTRSSGVDVAVEGSNNSRIVPLSSDVRKETVVLSSKPPLPPLAPIRRRTSADFDDPALLHPSSIPYSSTVQQLQQYSHRRFADTNTHTMLGQSACIDPRTGLGLLETDIDSNLVTVSPSSTVNGPRYKNDNQPNTNGCPATKISKSLLNLENGRMPAHQQLTPNSQNNPASTHRTSNDYRARSMEFLLDKENQVAIQAPENELQKGSGERKMSEHELRVQRSLQKLNVPDWYKNSSVPSQGFLLKRHSDVGHNSQSPHRWTAGTLPSKTTSLNSLGPHLLTTPKSPTCTINSPSPSHYSFSRWSTSRLNSGTHSSSTSPCGSARSSFNFRQPYLGWRSQERLDKPRTPAERLAAGFLQQNSRCGSQQSSPSLTEVRSSIKEVTSAIVHYVSGTRDSTDRLSPSLRYNTDGSSISSSPRGSTGRLCWLESSFVGNRPTKQPETPSGQCESKVPRGPPLSEKLNTGDFQSSYLCSTAPSEKLNEYRSGNSRVNNGSEATIKKLFDDYNVSVCRIKDRKENCSGDTATLDDILDSLLGLSSTSRTPSPARVSLESENIISPISMAEHSHPR